MKDPWTESVGGWRWMKLCSSKVMSNSKFFKSRDQKLLFFRKFRVVWKWTRNGPGQDQEKLENLGPDQDRTNFPNLRPNRTMTNKILKISDRFGQVGPGGSRIPAPILPWKTKKSLRFTSSDFLRNAKKNKNASFFSQQDTSINKVSSILTAAHVNLEPDVQNWTCYSLNR